MRIRSRRAHRPVLPPSASVTTCAAYATATTQNLQPSDAENFSAPRRRHHWRWRRRCWASPTRSRHHPGWSLPPGVSVGSTCRRSVAGPTGHPTSRSESQSRRRTSNSCSSTTPLIRTRTISPTMLSACSERSTTITPEPRRTGRTSPTTSSSTSSDGSGSHGRAASIAHFEETRPAATRDSASSVAFWATSRLSNHPRKR